MSVHDITEQQQAHDDGEVAALLRHFHEIEQVRVDCVREQDAIKDRLREILDNGTYSAGDAQVTVTAPPRRFDAHLAEQVLPPDLLQDVQRLVVDRDLAAQILPPALYALCQKDGSAQRVVRIR